MKVSVHLRKHRRSAPSVVLDCRIAATETGSLRLALFSIVVSLGKDSFSGDQFLACSVTYFVVFILMPRTMGS